MIPPDNSMWLCDKLVFLKQRNISLYETPGRNESDNNVSWNTNCKGQMQTRMTDIQKREMKKTHIRMSCL